MGVYNNLQKGVYMNYNGREGRGYICCIAISRKTTTEHLNIVVKNQKYKVCRKFVASTLLFPKIKT